MDPLALATRVAAVEHRRSCSDAERRAALLLADALREGSRRRRRTTEVQTIWVRPHSGPVHAGSAALAVAGSGLSVERPVLGLTLCAAAVVLLAGDLSARFGLVRRLTPARATQDVVARDPRQARVRLVVTAAYDAPAPGVLGRRAPARAQARLRRRLRGHLPGPYGALAAALLALVACTLARVLGGDGPVLGAVQLVPTVGALLGAAAAVDRATTAAPRHGAGAEASAAAVAVALVHALDAEPPRALAVDCVLAGAGGADALGFRHWLREQRRAGVRPEDVAVLHIAACGAGRPVVWVRDGLVLPLRFHPRLVALARRVGLPAHESRGASGGRAARAAGWPAVAVGCVDAAGTVPRLGTQADTAEGLDPQAMRATLEACLAFVRALDADLADASPVAEGPSQCPPAELPPPQAPPPPPTSARAARRAASAGGEQTTAGGRAS